MVGKGCMAGGSALLEFSSESVQPSHLSISFSFPLSSSLTCLLPGLSWTLTMCCILCYCACPDQITGQKDSPAFQRAWKEIRL